MNNVVLLLGGSGLLGGDLHDALAERGYKIVAPSREELDIAESEKTQLFVEKVRPYAIINSAALIDVDAIEADPRQAWQINAKGAGNVAHAAVKAQSRLIHISTNYVFGDNQSIYDEKSVPSPINMYGKTKLEGEGLVGKYCSAAHTRYYIVRTSWLYSNSRPTFVDSVAHKLLRGEDVDASAPHLGNPTYAPDVSNIIVDNFIGDACTSGIYHLINEVKDIRGGVSRLEIAKSIAELLGIPTTRVHEAAEGKFFKAQRPKTAVLKNTKLPPLPLWEDSLRTYILSAYR